MAILTELPADGENTDDRQIQPMEHEIQNGDDSGRDIGRVRNNDRKKINLKNYT